MIDRELCITSESDSYEVFWAPIRAKFTPLNRVPFGKFNGANGPPEWANRKLFDPPEAERRRRRVLAI